MAFQFPLGLGPNASVTTNQLSSMPTVVATDHGWLNNNPTPNTGVNPTIMGADVINIMMAQMLNVMQQANITPTGNTYATCTELVTAIEDIAYGCAGVIQYHVSTLPAGFTGQRAYVTDAVSPTFLGNLTGGGSTVTPVFYNGTKWVAG